MIVRRVVTGQTAQGKSVFVSDQEVNPTTVSVLPGAEFFRLWGSDEVAKLPTNGAAPSAPRYFPPAAGFRFVVFTVGPDRVTMPDDLDMRAAIAEIGEKLPGVVEVLEVDNPGMHTTDTVDCGLVLSGEVWLELDDGAEVHLRAGDCVIQNGTRHAWRNKSSLPCVVVGAIMGAERAT